MTGGTLPGEEAKGAMARRFVLDDRRPTSVVSQGIYLVIKTDLTVASKDVSVCIHINCTARKHTSFLGILMGWYGGEGRREDKHKHCG